MSTAPAPPYATILQVARQRIEKLEERNEFLEREIVRMGRVFNQQEADSMDKADLSRHGDKYGDHIQNE